MRSDVSERRAERESNFAKLLANRGCFLALAIAQVIQLRTAGAARLLDFHLGNARRMEREHALDAFAVGNAPNGKSLVNPATFPADHDPCENLDALLVPFPH